MGHNLFPLLFLGYFLIGILIIAYLHRKAKFRLSQINFRKHLESYYTKEEYRPEKLWELRKKWRTEDIQGDAEIDSFIEIKKEMEESYGNRGKLILYISFGLFWLPSIILAFINIWKGGD